MRVFRIFEAARDGSWSPARVMGQGYNICTREEDEEEVVAWEGEADGTEVPPRFGVALLYSTSQKYIVRLVGIDLV